MTDPVPWGTEMEGERGIFEVMMFAGANYLQQMANWQKEISLFNQICIKHNNPCPLGHKEGTFRG